MHCINHNVYIVTQDVQLDGAYSQALRGPTPQCLVGIGLVWNYSNINRWEEIFSKSSPLSVIPCKKMTLLHHKMVH